MDVYLIYVILLSYLWIAGLLSFNHTMKSLR